MALSSVPMPNNLLLFGIFLILLSRYLYSYYSHILNFVKLFIFLINIPFEQGEDVTKRC